MKTIFDIVSQIPIDSKDNLLIEMGESGMSVMIFSKEPLQIKRILLVNFQEEGNLIGNVQSILEKVHFSKFKTEQIRIYYNTHHFALVPYDFAIDNIQKDILQLNHGVQFDKEVSLDRIENAKIQLIYSVPNAMKVFINQKIGLKAGVHRNSVLIKNQIGRNQLRLVVFNEIIGVLLHTDNQLKFEIGRAHV